MLKLFIVALVLAAVVADRDTDWSNFKAKYNKKYSADEEADRKKIWSTNMDMIEKHNIQFNLRKSSYSLGENEYADMTSSEFALKRKNHKIEPRSHVESSERQRFRRSSYTYLPNTVDWRKSGRVTAVKNQGDCNAGWAFAATGVLESLLFTINRNTTSVSESNLVDCSRSYGNKGCEGGSVFKALTYVMHNGIDTESSYPYTPKDQSCKFNKTSAFYPDVNIQEVSNASEPSLRMEVANFGPVSVFIDASLDSFHLYKSGIYDDPKCNNTVGNHGVLLVGYGTQKDKDYWLVKNSWGTSWGEEGYAMMSRNKNNQCGILNCMVQAS